MNLEQLVLPASEPAFVRRHSFIELSARDRALTFFDTGTARELLGCFDQIESPWLALQDITPQSDDGCVVMKGEIDGESAVVVALEGAFQGGSLGEVSGMKCCAALDLATRDNEHGIKTHAILLLETGGVRLQEANLGLAATAEVMASIIELRKHAPVVCVVAGTVGCFGGMSLAVGLASYVIMTREARLGMNGPEVIEQEAGVDEFDSKDRSLIWAINGGEQRFETGLVDFLVEDSVEKIVETTRTCLKLGIPEEHRSEQVAMFRELIDTMDSSAVWNDPALLRGKAQAKSLRSQSKKPAGKPALPDPQSGKAVEP
jgi:malonate decarboxylase beta subunit